MVRCLMLLPVLLLVAGADPAVERAARKERAKLLGTWLAAPPAFLQPDEVFQGWWPILEFTADKVNVSTIERDGKKIVRKPAGTMTIVLDPTATPKTIDITADDGPRKGKLRAGIYEINGDELKIAEGRGNAARPTKFAEDRNTSVLVLRRMAPENLTKALAKLETDLLNVETGPAGVVLPVSRMAKPAAKTEALELTIEPNGRFKVPGRADAIDKLADLQTFLRDQRKAKPNMTVLVLRADRQARVVELFQASRAAQILGFTNLFVQTLRGDGEGRLEFAVPNWRKPVEDVIVLAEPPNNEDADLGFIVIKTGAESVLVKNAVELEKGLRDQRGQADVVIKDSVRVSPKGQFTVGGLVAVMDSCLSAGFPRVTLAPILEQDDTKQAKLPPPSAEDQGKAEKTIKAMYQAYEAKPALLSQRLREAAAICDDPPAKFVFLKEAADAAARAGQMQPSMDSITLLGTYFAIDPWPLKLEKFKKASPTPAVVDAALKEASDADNAGNREFAARFVRIADLAAKEVKDSDLSQYVDERRELLKLPKVRFDPYGPLPKASDNKPSAALVERSKGKEPTSVLSLVLWYGIPIMLVSTLLTTGVVYWLLRERAVRRRLAQSRGNQFEVPSDEPPAATGV